MVHKLYIHVTVVQRGDHLGHQGLERRVGHFGVGLVEGLELRQVLVVDGIPVQPVLFLIVPEGVVLVHGVPEYTELAGIALLGLTERQIVGVGIVHQRVSILVARADGQCQEQRSYYLDVILHCYIYKIGVFRRKHIFHC